MTNIVVVAVTAAAAAAAVDDDNNNDDDEDDDDLLQGVKRNTRLIFPSLGLGLEAQSLRFGLDLKAQSDELSESRHKQVFFIVLKILAFIVQQIYVVVCQKNTIKLE